MDLSAEEEEADACPGIAITAQATTSAYKTRGPNGADSKGVHCSCYDEFCFFCSYEQNPNAAGTEADLYGSLVDMVQHLAGLKREPCAIVNHVHDAYEENVRQHIPNQPDWSKDSIHRHLMYSGQFELIHETSVGQMLTALVARQNATLVDVSTNLVIEDHRKAFCDTISTLIKWKNCQRATRGGAGKITSGLKNR